MGLIRIARRPDAGVKRKTQSRKSFLRKFRAPRRQVETGGGWGSPCEEIEQLVDKAHSERRNIPQGGKTGVRRSHRKAEGAGFYCGNGGADGV